MERTPTEQPDVKLADINGRSSVESYEDPATGTMHLQMFLTHRDLDEMHGDRLVQLREAVKQIHDAVLYFDKPTSAGTYRRHLMGDLAEEDVTP